MFFIFTFFHRDLLDAGKLLEIMHVKGIPICAATILSTSTSISFFQATLEPHLKQVNENLNANDDDAFATLFSFLWFFQFHLTPIVLGLVFVVTGATYGASAPGWGWLCDKYFKPKTISVIGGLILLAGVSIVGPAPFIPLRQWVQSKSKQTYEIIRMRNGLTCVQ